MVAKHIGGAILALAVFPLLLDCGGAGPLGNLPGGMPGACSVDLKNPEAIMKASFGLQGEAEGKVKAALAAGANLQALAGKVEADVTAGCVGLAKDLGATDADLQPKEQGPGKKAEAACNVAAKLIGDAKAKLGASAKLEIKVVPPKCEASMDMAANCAAECKGNVKPGEVKATCEGGEISGKCDGECKGTCTVQAGANCEGTCKGSCDGKCEGTFSGKCDGKCEGKCDGKDSKGTCAGTCDGKCDAKAKGNCSGKCSGGCSASCEMTGQASCKGDCSGGCSVDIKEPKCSGKVKPPEMSAECKANCDAKLNANLECKPASVLVNFVGKGDAQAQAKLKTALEKNLPVLLKITIGMKDSLGQVTGSVKASVEGLQAVVKGGGQAAMKVGGCVAGALKAQVDATASINVSVKASASASASAGAG